MPAKTQSKNKLWLILVIILLLAGGVFAYFYLNNKPQTAVDELSAENQKMTAVENAGSPATADQQQVLLSAIENKEPINCEMADEAGTVQTIQTNSDWSKIKIQVTSPTDPAVSMLMLDDVTYAWIEGEATGTKMTLSFDSVQEMSNNLMTELGDQLEAVEPTTPETTPAMPKINCQPVGAVNFNLPQGVEFVDLGSMMEMEMSNPNSSEIPN